MSIQEWREEIERMDYELGVTTGRVKAAADGSELKEIRQRQADVINWRLLAFQLADPHMDALYREYAAARGSEDGHHARSQDDTSWWAKMAATAGGFGVLTLLVSRGFQLSGWVTLVGVLLLIGMAFCAASAMLARGDRPDTTVSMALNARIHEVESLCKRCRDIDDYNAVKAAVERPVGPVRPLRPASAEVAPRAR